MSPNDTPTQNPSKNHTESTAALPLDVTAYEAPNPADAPPLRTLLEALGDLRQTGRTSPENGYRKTWNTDAKSLGYLKGHVAGVRDYIEGGIAAIGYLLYLAAANHEAGDIPAGVVMDAGLLVHDLASALPHLTDLEYQFGEGRGHDSK